MAVAATQLVFLRLASMAVTGFSLRTFNAARYKPTSQSSVYEEFSTAEKAVDGNYDPVYVNKSCTCTGVSDMAPWWSVDLGQQYHVASVRITNRLTVGSRLHDVTITVMAETSATPITCGHYSGTADDGANITVTCGKPTLGRHVNISKPATDIYDHLTVCEVEVMVLKSRITLQRLAGKKSRQERGTVSMETTLPDCAHACLHSDSCVGVNYSGGSSQCQLLTTTALSDAIIDDEWSLYVVMP